MSNDHYLKLQIERDKLRDALIDLFRVVESGDWYPEGDYAPDRQVMQIMFKDADAACDRAEKVIAETSHEPV